jgi:hypothetical protein
MDDFDDIPESERPKVGDIVLYNGDFYSVLGWENKELGNEFIQIYSIHNEKPITLYTINHIFDIYWYDCDVMTPRDIVKWKDGIK